MIPSALALTMVTVAEGLLVIRSYAEKNKYKTNSNQDLFAFGAANVGSGALRLLHGRFLDFPHRGHGQAGSRTQLPSLVLAGGTMLLLLFGTELLAQIPSPAIGAVVAVAVFKLLGLEELRELWGASRSEFGIAMACFLGVLVVGPLGGLLFAFVLSLINLVRRSANPTIDVLVGSRGSAVSLIEIRIRCT